MRESNRYNIAGETDQLEVELLHTLNLHDERQNAVNSVIGTAGERQPTC